MRFTTILGTKVLSKATDDVLGSVADILIHPDTGSIEGFFLSSFSFFITQDHFLASSDIIRFGQTITVREEDVIGPVEERVRLESLMKDTRRVLHQPVITEDGHYIGVARDVQFSTTTFAVEWIFPRSYFRWKAGIPVSDVLEVRKDAVVVRSSVIPILEQEFVAG